MIKLNKNNLLRFQKEKIINQEILVRVDFNVDIFKNKIISKYRIESFKKTLSFLKENKAKKIVLATHLADPLKKEKKYSLKQFVPQIEKILKTKIFFIENLNQSPLGNICLLENLRFWPEEKKLKISFAKKLARFGNVFINEAFSVSHRKHTSIYLLPKLLPTFYGLQFETEIRLLNKVLTAKKKTFILGGAKISTKLPLIKNLIKGNNLVILGGGLANTFLKSKSFEIGKSLIEEKILNKVKKIKSIKILTPFDFINQRNQNLFLGEIKKNDIIYDIGPKSLRTFFTELKKAKIIVWNGPLGFVENKKFEKGTFIFIKFLLKLKNKFILVGGGDTLSFLERKGFLKKFKNISTGGGAMLEYLSTKKLNGIE